MIIKEPQLEKNDEGTYCVDIIDEELDIIECRFDNDGCVHINTKDLTYLTLSVDNLTRLLNLIEETEELYED
jgi:hypothetical protein